MLRRKHELVFIAPISIGEETQLNVGDRVFIGLALTYSGLQGASRGPGDRGVVVGVHLQEGSARNARLAGEWIDTSEKNEPRKVRYVPNETNSAYPLDVQWEYTKNIKKWARSSPKKHRSLFDEALSVWTTSQGRKIQQGGAANPPPPLDSND